MKRNVYSDEYQKLWDYFIIAEKYGLIGSGGKAKGYEAYKIKGCTKEDTEYLIKCLVRQIEAKLILRRQGEFVPQFQSPERWIRNERFEDEISTGIIREPVTRMSKKDEARKAIADLTGESTHDTDGIGKTGKLWSID